ncbi:serine/threonine phosophatase PP1 [Histomonas meleagridis]|uniref:serine/threonine phosophatase PP1 n=1 Tax=Histomonas meleagridis TaxID=135588 RepID=UPI003559761D|nr:serine/threonine phosophatase PP1 [Histomonas meleagridis]KAH0802876.1 serine/threonine phosophatase PP1 [Histomonas meleagridis]
MDVIIDKILSKLVAVRESPLGTPSGLTVGEIIWLCQTVRKIFLDQPILLKIQGPVTVCGDIHGQYHDLLRLFEVCKYPPETNYLFLGDYVDRGKQSIETICLLFALKVKYPEIFFLLRGNHESSKQGEEFEFYKECNERYSPNIWHIFCDVFNCLPVAAILNNKIFCVHGGISQYIKSIDDISNIQRPTEIPDEGILCDLMWSDPDPEANDWAPNARGTSYFFGVDHLNEFRRKFGFDLVCRGHQYVETGFDFPFGEAGGIVTVFSAPNYCYEVGNRAAVMKVDEEMKCSFVVFDPIIDWDEIYQNKNDLDLNKN